MNENVEVIAWNQHFYEELRRVSPGEQVFVCDSIFAAIAFPETVIPGIVITADAKRNIFVIRTDTGDKTCVLDDFIPLHALQMLTDSRRSSGMVALLSSAQAQGIPQREPRLWNALQDDFAKCLLSRALCTRLKIPMTPCEQMDGCIDSVVQTLVSMGESIYHSHFHIAFQ